jgi:O-succinylbenzoic acid--CoA ligase
MSDLLCPLFEWAKKDPLHPCIVTTGRSWSYQEIDALVAGVCVELKGRSIQKLAFIATPSVNTILLILAALRLGIIACPLSAKLPSEQIPDALAQLGTPQFLDSNRLTVQPQVSSTPPFLNRKALATFLFTSGSSGRPKIACHSVDNHYLSALGILEALSLKKASRYQLSLPLYHVSGLAILFRTLLAGATLLLSPSPLELSPSHISLVPTQLYRLMHQRALSQLTCILLGGAPVSELLRTARHLPLLESYGLTEMSSAVALGDVLPYREVKIQEGEIYVRGGTLFQGYWDSALQRCVSPVNAEGWFATRDLGEWDKEGKLRILGRKDRLFISGGENIQPEEIERALCQIPGIIQATVIPIPDPEWGSRPVAFIEDTTRTHTTSSLYLTLACLLPSFKRPVRVLPYPKESDGMKVCVNKLYKYLS